LTQPVLRSKIIIIKVWIVYSRIELIPVSVDDYENNEDLPILYEIKKSGIEIKLEPSGRKLAKM
jgi:hypothetical protein